MALLELWTKFGVSKDQLSIAGYADTAPVEDKRHSGRPAEESACRHRDPEADRNQRRARKTYGPGNHPAAGCAQGEKVVRLR